MNFIVDRLTILALTLACSASSVYGFMYMRGLELGWKALNGVIPYPLSDTIASLEGFVENYGEAKDDISSSDQKVWAERVRNVRNLLKMKDVSEDECEMKLDSVAESIRANKQADPYSPITEYINVFAKKQVSICGPYIDSKINSAVKELIKNDILKKFKDYFSVHKTYYTDQYSSVAIPQILLGYFDSLYKNKKLEKASLAREESFANAFQRQVDDLCMIVLERLGAFAHIYPTIRKSKDRVYSSTAESAKWIDTAETCLVIDREKPGRLVGRVYDDVSEYLKQHQDVSLGQKIRGIFSR